MNRNKPKITIEKVKMRSNRVSSMGKILQKTKVYKVGEDLTDEDAAVMVATQTAEDVSQKASKKDDPAEKK